MVILEFFNEISDLKLDIGLSKVHTFRMENPSFDGWQLEDVDYTPS